MNFKNLPLLHIPKYKHETLRLSHVLAAAKKKNYHLCAAIYIYISWWETITVYWTSRCDGSLLSGHTAWGNDDGQKHRSEEEEDYWNRTERLHWLIEPCGRVEIFLFPTPASFGSSISRDAFRSFLFMLLGFLAHVQNPYENPFTVLVFTFSCHFDEEFWSPITTWRMRTGKWAPYGCWVLDPALAAATPMRWTRSHHKD